MYRYLVRFSVALLTFAIGLLISAIPGVLHRAPLTGLARFRHASCHRKMGYVPSPVLSIGTQPNEPMKIFYSSTSLEPADPNQRQVHFLVENRSDRDIKNFTINFRSSWTSNAKGGGGGLSVLSNPQQVIRIGESQFVTINCDADQVLTVWVGSTEFADGSTWNNEQEFK